MRAPAIVPFFSQPAHPHHGQGLAMPKI